MKKNYIYGIIAAVIIVGILIGIKLGGNLTGGSLSPEGSDQQVPEAGDVTIIPVEPTLTIPPSPTFAPISDTIKSIDNDNIIATGKSGDMTLPKNPEILSVFIQRGNDLIPATIEDVKVGQKVTIKIITPGKKAELIIIP